MEISLPFASAVDKWEENPFNNIAQLGRNLVIATGFVNAIGIESDVGGEFLDYFKETSLKIIDYYHESHTLNQ